MSAPRKRAGAKHGSARPGRAQSEHPKSGRTHAGSAKSGGAKSGGAKSGGAKSGGAKSGGAKSGAPKPDAPKGPKGPKGAKGGGAKRTARPPVVPGSGGVGGTVKAVAEGPMRVQRALARAGVLSRREADRAVADGRVRVNGEAALIGQSVDPARDVVTLDGTPVTLTVDKHRWIVLHKPAGVMTTRRDPGGRRTVFDLVDKVPGLVYVGRLDFMTEGVLLLTTDGRAAHALTHPSREVERTYLATVRGDAAGAVRAARRGVELEDGVVIPTDVSAQPLGNRRWAFEVTITEGKTHEVRRLCDALGLEVERLVRTRFGPVRLGDLPVGGTRALSAKELAVLDALTPAD